MRTYADPTRCPDCATPIPGRPGACPGCGLRLEGPTAASLFSTLQAADRLLAELRAASLATPPIATPNPVAAPASGPGLMPGPLPAYPTPAARPARTGLSGASVPKILLTLGALCLLVAAVTFLAVAWSWLGVGGRTAVLVGLTGIAAGATWWAHRARLRAAAESLGTVALGLLALDLTGADNAGWFGSLPAGGLSLVVGTVVGAAAVAAAVLSSRRSPTLVAPQVVAGLAGWTAVAGLVEVTGHLSTSATVGIVALLAVAWVSHRAGLAVLPWAAGVAAVTWWVPLLGDGLLGLGDDPSLRGLWVDGLAWPVVSAALLVAAPLAVTHRRVWAPGVFGGPAALLLTVVALAPVLDGSTTVALGGALVALTVWASLSHAAPAPWRPVPLVALLPALLMASAVLLGSIGEVVARVLDLADPWTATASVRLPAASYDAHPALLPVGAVVALLVLSAAARALHLVLPVRPAAVLGATVVGVSAVGAVAAYAVPLWLVVALLLVLSVALVAVALAGLGRPDEAPAGAGLVVALLAIVAAFPSDVLTAVALGVATSVAAAGWWAGRSEIVRDAGRLLVPVAGGALIWTVAELAGLDPAWRALPVLLALGTLAVVAPRLTVEGGAAATALVASAASVAAGLTVSDSRGLWSLAIALTLAGAAQVVSSVVNEHRRELAWTGGLLLAMATWVRLYDAGVTTPEAYTLPSALVLVTVGTIGVLRKGLPTLTALTPGLTLATVPTLLEVLAGEPVSWRALLLGAASLGLVFAGTRLRWNAPLVVGAVVGALLVVREAGPYAATLPPWLLIALAGTLLTVVGITWERGLRDLRRGAAYLGHLR